MLLRFFGPSEVVSPAPALRLLAHRRLNGTRSRLWTASTHNDSNVLANLGSKKAARRLFLRGDKRGGMKVSRGSPRSLSMTPASAGVQQSTSQMAVLRHWQQGSSVLRWSIQRWSSGASLALSLLSSRLPSTSTLVAHRGSHDVLAYATDANVGGIVLIAYLQAKYGRTRSEAYKGQATTTYKADGERFDRSQSEEGGKASDGQEGDDGDELGGSHVGLGRLGAVLGKGGKGDFWGEGERGKPLGETERLSLIAGFLISLRSTLLEALDPATLRARLRDNNSAPTSILVESIDECYRAFRAGYEGRGAVRAPAADHNLPAK